MAYHRSAEPQRFSVSLVTQGRHRFYTLTLPSDILANTCYVTSRDEDPKAGFQRVLDKKRAQQIADYIDVGLGTIPTSIILSAQKAAELEVIGKGKTLQFRDNPKAFLVLDGQHRVYGFSLAKTSLRVPVVIYNNLSPRDESRLFIDINTKQRPVPNELLLDIKKLAEYESGSESLMGEVFDRFHSAPESALIGLMSPHERTSAKISRVTFNAGLKPLLEIFTSSEVEEIFDALNAYFTAFIEGTRVSRRPTLSQSPPSSVPLCCCLRTPRSGSRTAMGRPIPPSIFPRFSNRCLRGRELARSKSQAIARGICTKSSQRHSK